MLINSVLTSAREGRNMIRFVIMLAIAIGLVTTIKKLLARVGSDIGHINTINNTIKY
jgi:phosphate/sulfate permease